MSNDVDYKAFTFWGMTVEIQAPKVEIRECTNTLNESDILPEVSPNRGLFATDTIHPGERVVFIPARALVSAEMLQKRGSHLLNRIQCINEENLEISSLEPDHPRISSLKSMVEQMEENVIIMIELFRCFVEEGSIPGIEDSTTQSVNIEYIWRKDDAVALFIVACTSILEISQKQCDEQGKENDDITTDDKMGKQDDCEHVSFLPYIAVLPSDFPTHPLYYNESEMIRLSGTNSYTFVTRMLSQIESDWNQLQSALQAFWGYYRDWMKDNQLTSSQLHDKETTDSTSFTPGKFSLEKYKWALSNIYSRSTDMLKASEEDGHHVRVLAPFLDMFNHHLEGHLTSTMDSEGNISMFNSSSEPILTGKEIHNNYGQVGNDKLLTVYGFVIPDNPFDSVQIYAPLNPSDPLYAMKIGILSRCGIDSNNPFFLKKSVDEEGSILPENLLSTLRLTGIQSAEELMSISMKVMDDDEKDITVPFISKENEYGALVALGSALETMSRTLALSLINDENLGHASSTTSTTIIDHSQDIIPARKENIYNTKVLCESEYEILLQSLQEINSRIDDF